jgi:transposase
VEAQALAAAKKNATRLGAHLVFVDESGFLLLPSVHKTWSPRGQTPVVRHFYRRDKISVISGVSVSPRRRRVGLYFQCHEQNIGHDGVCAFLRELLRHLRGNVIVIWDRASIHRGERIREICHRFPRLHLELLPAYAPELNPDELVWSMAKRKLANGRAEDLKRLLHDVNRALQELRRSQTRLRSCFHRSDLPPFLQ